MKLGHQLVRRGFTVSPFTTYRGTLFEFAAPVPEPPAVVLGVVEALAALAREALELAASAEDSDAKADWNMAEPKALLQ